MEQHKQNPYKVVEEDASVIIDTPTCGGVITLPPASSVIKGSIVIQVGASTITIQEQDDWSDTQQIELEN